MASVDGQYCKRVPAIRLELAGQDAMFGASLRTRKQNAARMGPLIGQPDSSLAGVSKVDDGLIDAGGPPLGRSW